MVTVRSKRNNRKKGNSGVSASEAADAAATAAAAVAMMSVQFGHPMPRHQQQPGYGHPLLTTSLPGLSHVAPTGSQPEVSSDAAAMQAALASLLGWIDTTLKSVQSLKWHKVG